MIDHVERRFLSLFLAVIMVFSMLPISALAATLFTTTVLDGKVSISGEGTEGLGTGTNDTFRFVAFAQRKYIGGIRKSAP